jgi:hypothetical protein
MSRQIPSAFGLALALVLTPPACAYDVPLSESSIRDAYFLGTRLDGLNPDFLARYTLRIPQLKQGTCTSSARIETPFLKVAKYSSSAPNYSAQAALKDFYGKPATVDLYLYICYWQNAPRNAVRVRAIQGKKESAPFSVRSVPYQEPTDFGYLAPNGEQITLEFKADVIDSSDLTIVIDTPNEQHAEAVFDLRTLR